MQDLDTKIGSPRGCEVGSPMSVWLAGILLRDRLLGRLLAPYVGRCDKKLSSTYLFRIAEVQGTPIVHHLGTGFDVLFFLLT